MDLAATSPPESTQKDKGSALVAPAIISESMLRNGQELDDLRKTTREDHLAPCRPTAAGSPVPGSVVQYGSEPARGGIECALPLRR